VRSFQAVEDQVEPVFVLLAVVAGLERVFRDQLGEVVVYRV